MISYVIEYSAVKDILCGGAGVFWGPGSLMESQCFTNDTITKDRLYRAST